MIWIFLRIESISLGFGVLNLGSPSILPLEPQLHFFFALVIFQGRIFHFYLGPPSDFDPPIYGLPCSWQDNHTWLLTFCLGWPRTVILPISESQVAVITGMSHPAEKYKYLWENVYQEMMIGLWWWLLINKWRLCYKNLHHWLTRLSVWQKSPSIVHITQ
jgi:hypothetical protein